MLMCLSPVLVTKTLHHLSVWQYALHMHALAQHRTPSVHHVPRPVHTYQTPLHTCQTHLAPTSKQFIVFK